MKIYTRCVVDMSTGRIEDADSFEYDGPVIQCKDAPSPPPAPDYTGAAVATANANKVNQNTPYGSLTYSNVPGTTDRWQSDITLSPTGQQLLDYSNNAALGLGAETGQALGRVNDTLSKPFDFGSLGDVADTAYSAQTSRLDPQWQQNEAAIKTQLANQGITQGSEAYDNAMRTFNQGKNDAYTQARLAAINTEPQTYQLANALRTQPLNELNALRTGSQVTNPTFNSSTPQGPNLLGAAQAQGQYNQGLYNAQVGQQNSMMSGLFGLGAAGIGAYPF